MGIDLNESQLSPLQCDLKKTLTAAKNLENALCEEDSNVITASSSALNALTTKLGLQEWFIDNAKLNDKFALRKCLQALSTELSRYMQGINHTDIIDDEIISQASGGSALHGICLGNNVTRALKPILQQPTTCAFTNPSSTFVREELMFTSIRQATNFRKTMNTSGKSFALSLDGSIGFAHGGISGGFESAKLNIQEKLKATTTKSAAHVIYAYVPMKSFRFSKSLMNITEEAKQEALSIDDENGALCFLEDYGSHVPCGEYQFGGIFWKVTEMSATKEMSSFKLIEECTKRVSNNLSVGFRSLGYGLSIDYRSITLEKDDESSYDDQQCYTADITTKIECTGPDALSYEIFRRTLEVSKQSWHLIDRPMSPTTLIPVWELLASDKKYGRQAELLREGWLKKVQHLHDIPWMQNIMQRARVKAWLGDTQFGTQNKNKKISNKEDAELLVRQELIRVCDLDFTSSNSGNEVVDFFLLLLRVDMEFSMDLTVNCLRRNDIQSMLLRFVSSNDRKAMQNLHVLFENVINAKLTYSTPLVQLDESFYEALHKSTQLVALGDSTSEWEAPIVEIADIPNTIEQISISMLSTSMVDMRLLTQRIGDLLVKNLIIDNAPKRKEMWDIASKYGCRKDGFIRDLKKEEVGHIINQMRAVVESEVVIDESSDDDMVDIQFFDKQMYAKPTPSDGTPLKSLLIVNSQPDVLTDLPRVLLYTLKHRLNIVKEIYANEKLLLTSKKKDKIKGPIVFDNLLNLVKSLTPMARAEVYRLLLDRRFLVPFLIPVNKSQFQCEVPALDLIDTLIVSGRSSLTSNIDAVRVAVVSQRPSRSSSTKDWIKNVFHVDSVHCLDCIHRKKFVTRLGSVCEIGWGFIESKAVYHTAIVLHVIGDSTPLQSFIDSFADVLVVDVGTTQKSAPTLSRGWTIHWQHEEDEDVDESSDDDDSGDEMDTNSKVMQLRCDLSQSYKLIAEFILSKSKHSQERQALLEMDIPNTISNNITIPKSNLHFLGQIDFSTLRTQVLRLQQYFTIESRHTIARQREIEQAARAVYDHEINIIKSKYAKTTHQVMKHPLVMYFVHILQLPSAARREMMLVNLEQYLAENCQDLSIIAREKYRQAREKLNREQTSTNYEATQKATQEWSNMVTGMEHLWRELSHAFATNPSKYKYLVSLATRHLLDGFPLELMDGDAAMVNMKWIRAVFNELEDELRGRRVFVLSIMGVQSSGKSTLLNYMFGVRLRTSVARCTRGVNIQLLKCEDRAEYDYILLLDTEGIRSPEFVDLEDSVWRDNRMATLAILPSDATIILTKGESTVTISEILPIVLSAYLDSKLAEEHGGNLASKFYFAFNQIDVNQASNMESIIDTLMKSLRENAKKVEDLRTLGTEPSSTTQESSTRFFSDFQSNIHVEELSDVRFLGMTQGQTEPPMDTPFSDYGERLLRFRDYIHTRACQRAKDWKARTFFEVNECFDLVWQCISTSNFQFDFIAAYERISYENLVRCMTQHTRDLAKIYSDAFDDVLKQISADNAAKVKFNPSSKKYLLLLESKVQDKILKLDEAVKTDLSDDKYTKWSLNMERQWNERKQAQKSDSFRLLQNKVEHVFNYDNYVKTYKNQLQDMLTKHIRYGNQLTDEVFDEMFNTVLKRVRSQHQPTAPFVSRSVHNVFYNYQLFTPDQLGQLCDDEFARMKLNSLTASKSGFFGSIIPFFGGGGSTATTKEQQVEIDVQDFVKSHLSNVDRYNDEVVINCVTKAKNMFHKKRWTSSLINVAILALYVALCDNLRAIQERWDLANSVSSKFASCKPTMRVFAQNLCKGHKAADLLILMLDTWLKDNLSVAFNEELVGEVATMLKGQSWVQSAEIMQATLDKHLVELIRDSDIHTMLNWVTRPLKHNEYVTTRLIQTKVQECFLRVATTTFTNIKQCIVVAATAASNVNRNRSARFVFELQLELQKCLKQSGTSALVENLPKVDDEIMNCDEQGPQIFSTNKSLSVLNAVLDSLDLYQSKIQPNEVLSSNIAIEVLQIIRNESRGANYGVIPRCGQPCPMCGCPCTKGIDHISSSNNEEVLHDTYHQPAGLSGTFYTTSKKLVEKSCVQSTIENSSLELDDGKTYLYKEFYKAFPSWTVPNMNNNLPLREYIFANYQDDLSTLHNKPKCVAIPREYFHDIDDIARRIDRLLMKSNVY